MSNCLRILRTKNIVAQTPYNVNFFLAHCARSIMVSIPAGLLHLPALNPAYAISLAVYDAPKGECGLAF